MGIIWDNNLETGKFSKQLRFQKSLRTWFFYVFLGFALFDSRWGYSTVTPRKIISLLVNEGFDFSLTLIAITCYDSVKCKKNHGTVFPHVFASCHYSPWVDKDCKGNTVIV